MSRADRGADQPRAVIHRRILDVAESNPEASLAAIAEEVTGASPNLVERVLDEYGDPGNEPESGDQNDQDMNATDPATPETDSANGQGGSATDEPTETPAATDLSEKQRRTLRVLYERPGASQGDLAQQLDVTRATVSRRLNAIPGFDWSDRREFAESVFDRPDRSAADAETEDDSGPVAEERTEATDSEAADERGDDGIDTDGTETDAAGTEQSNDGDADLSSDGSSSRAERREAVDPAALDAVEGALADLEARIEAVESEAAGSKAVESEAAGSEESCGTALPPELAHKVVHACMESDRLTEDEELDVLRAFMEE
ncbi:hypothetical protein C475_16511 [Halosimplex carlsbadense 2-9-1]|uniref:Uncharacterized protein n=1 Tax=Halosimplex carlsbadense 2-9-1 TaxID=797114 RepID=M0CK26_9EURY|nr:winged helix-turn-helix transcriptional regulator [Halosimplex carlsbadense]ELZ22722.1 hypothetical protein C475_16511 [Halosimplex carlsbadense 2-9-1]